MTATDWLALSRAPGVGAATLSKLLHRFSTAPGIRRASDADLRAAGLSERSIQAMRHPDPHQLDADLNWLERSGVQLVTCEDESYPDQLREIARAPVALFVLGDATLLHLPQLAIVGSRHATRGGLENAHDFSAALVRQGLTITSGMALGVDGAAHRAALDAGGRTVAVVGTGLDVVYPAAHRDLAAEIAEHGCLVSEYPPGTPPRAGHFPARNRIIAGLSVGVLVVEAGVQSGSLITARMATEQNRDVFAIPGSIHNPLARGCHHLIKTGCAKLTETAGDLLDEIGAAVGAQIASARHAAASSPNSAEDQAAPPLDAEYQALLEHIGFDPISMDRLVEVSQLTVAAVSSMLLRLELDGHVESRSGGTYCRTTRSGS